MNKLNLVWPVVMAFTLSACGSDSGSNVGINDDGEKTARVAGSPFSVACTNPTTGSAANNGISIGLKTEGGDEPEYLVTNDSIMEGTISAQGNGYEQLGWNFYYNVGTTLFVSGYQNSETQSYTANENDEVAELATFIFERPLVMFGSDCDETLLASDGPSDNHSARKLYTVDAKTGLITQKIDYSIHDYDTGNPGEGTVAWPTALKVRGDYLYVPFQKLDDAGGYYTPDADTAYVAVFHYPLEDGDAPFKVISDVRTSNIGVNGMTTALIEAENGDLYSSSNGSISGGFNPPSTKPSGILKIKDGETEFDTDYFFNIEEATNGGKLFWFDYVGNNKALARILVNEDGCKAISEEDDNACWWSAYSKDFFTQKLVVIDLVDKSVTDIPGVPLHQKRYTSPLNIIDGKVYVSIETAEDAYVYQIDVEAATAVKGAKIEGKTAKGFYNLFD